MRLKQRKGIRKKMAIVDFTEAICDQVEIVAIAIHMAVYV